MATKKTATKQAATKKTATKQAATKKTATARATRKASALDDVDAVLAALKAKATKRTLDGMARFGIPADHA